MYSISIKDLLNELNLSKTNIIDIRSPFQYKLDHIPTAINISYQALRNNPEKYLEKNKKYYIYCQSGHSSNNLVIILNQLGYTTVNIIGGYNNYLLMK